MNLGLLVLRVVIGLLFVGHGAQKLFGWFDGPGVDGTAGFFESLGLRPGPMMALGAGGAELGGGALFALGLLTPLASAMLIGVMAVAVATVHWQNGPWVTDNGFEYNLVLAAGAFAVAAIGAGGWSLDDAFGLDLDGAWWASGALVAGLLGAVVVLTAARLVARRGHGETPVTG